MIGHVNIPEERIAKLRTVKNCKERLKDFLDVDMTIENPVLVEGHPLQVLRAKEIIKAFGRGFSFEDSLDLLDEDYLLDIMEVKEFTGKSTHRQITMKGRVIGMGGLTKKTIEKNSGTKMVVYGKTVSLIGKSENIKVARTAIEMILSGSKHNSVYRFLEEHKVL